MPRKDLLPGYRHPYMDATQFATGVGDVPRTLTDLAMSQFSYDLRRKPQWFRDYLNHEVRTKWAEEGSSHTWKVRIPGGSVDIKLSATQVNYVLEELAGYIALRDKRFKCQVACFERIWESNDILDAGSLADLQQGILALRHAAGSRFESMSWLLDPYLFPLIYDQTIVSSPEGPVTLQPPRYPFNTADGYAISRRFAHLPSIAYVSSSTSPTTLPTVEFRSYINNLDPSRHSALYSLLSSVLASFIPLFEHTLTDLHRINPLTPRISGACRYSVWDEPEPPEHSDDEEGWVDYESEMTRWSLNRPIQLPDVPPSGYKGGLDTRRHTVSLLDREIKVMVSINEIRLDQDNTVYPGSQWHVEGMRNERITACAVFVASSENVSSASLQFRMSTTYPDGFMLGDSGATLRTWGLRDVDPCHQYIGSVPLQGTGLGVVFPNIYQHQVAPLHLTDPTKPGHITFVLFWLIDPDLSGNTKLGSDIGRHQTVVSTADVPPQQKEWISEALDNALDSKIPVEIVERIVDASEGLMDSAEAEEVRREMLEEREMFWKMNNMNYFCVPFDVWGQI